MQKNGLSVTSVGNPVPTTTLFSVISNLSNPQ